MVIILLNIALTLGLIALATGIGLLNYGQYSQLENKRVSPARVFGGFITVLAFISIFVTVYVGVNFWSASNNARMMRNMGQGGPGQGYGQQGTMMPPKYGPSAAPGTNGSGSQKPISQKPRQTNPNYPMGPIPANEQEMRPQNRPGPPERTNSFQNQQQ